MSWKPEVYIDSDGKWCGNALRFATKEEAEANARELLTRWFVPSACRAVESEDPVNYAWVDGKLVELSKRDKLAEDLGI